MLSLNYILCFGVIYQSEKATELLERPKGIRINQCWKKTNFSERKIEARDPGNKGKVDFDWRISAKDHANLQKRWWWR